MEAKDVTKEQFAAYVACQNVGCCNMLDPYVCVICKFDQGVHLAIIKHYDELCKLYPEISEKRR